MPPEVTKAIVGLLHALTKLVKTLEEGLQQDLNR
jgi:hypothetical protein